MRLGNRTPTLLRTPAGGVETVGPQLAELGQAAGLTLDPWQRDILDGACQVRADGRWAAFEVGEILPRQNGKNAAVEVRQLGGLFLLDEKLQVHSAHEFKTTVEHRLRIAELIENTPDLDRQVKIIRTGSADQGIELLPEYGGNRLRFVARTKGSGRGLTGDTVYLDEAYALTAAQMGALLFTMGAVPNPQLWYFSSAPHYTSDFLHALLKRAVSDEETALFLAAWESQADARFDDVEAWYRANPALGYRLTEEQIRNELRTMSNTPETLAEYARERMGIREGGDGESGIVDYAQWLALVDERSKIASRRSIGLSVSPDGSAASFSRAGRREDGRVHLETIRRDSGTGWVVDEAKHLHQKWRVPIHVNPAAPESALFKALTDARVPLVEVGSREYAQTCGTLLDHVKNGTARHIDQDSMNRAASAAGKRGLGTEGLWIWSRPGAADISAWTAVTLALVGVGGQSASVYEEREMRTVG